MEQFRDDVAFEELNRRLSEMKSMTDKINEANTIESLDAIKDRFAKFCDCFGESGLAINAVSRI